MDSWGSRASPGPGHRATHIYAHTLNTLSTEALLCRFNYVALFLRVIKTLGTWVNQLYLNVHVYKRPVLPYIQVIKEETRKQQTKF